MESTEESGSPYEAEGDQDPGQPDHTDSPQPDDGQGTPDDAEEAGAEAGERDKERLEQAGSGH